MQKVRKKIMFQKIAQLPTPSKNNFIISFHSDFSWTFLSKEKRCNEVIPM